jgi:hydroxyacylglutathione hydrolase
VQVVTSHDPGPLSNSYLVYDHEGGAALFVDGGTPTAPVHEEVRARRLRPELLVVTHRHPDHIAHVREYAARYGIPVAGHPAEAEACGGFDRLLSGGEALTVGELEVTPLHVPGHTAGHLAVLVRHGEERAVFTGDTLFAGSVGGTRGPGHTSLADLRSSVLEVLLALPPDTVVHPGHTVPTTVAAERAGNAFVRAWSGEELPAPRPCLVTGAPATLLLRAPDYDGGTKCWVRWPDGGEDVVPGSRVREA